jgi:hypothetical protein
MATKKPEGGSNLGLIITLVFFVLTTVILGVTTYLGYSEQDKFVSEAKKAKDETKKAEAERDWNRFKANLFRQMMGKPAPKTKDPMSDPATIARNMDQLRKGNCPLSKSMDDEKEVQAFVTEQLDPKTWEAGVETPKHTYETKLAEKVREIDTLKAQVKAKEVALAAEKLRADTAIKDSQDRKNVFDKQLAVQKKKADDDQEAKTREIDRLQKKLDADNESKQAVVKSVAALSETIKKLQAENAKLSSTITADRREKDKQQALFEEVKSELDALKQLTGKDLNDKDMEDRRLEEDARKELRAWDVKRHPWRIVDLDRTGKLPYINLGSADGLQPQVTFNIHDLGTDGRLKELPKGKLEVVRIVGPHLALARITTQATKAEREKNPIVKGDYLFNHQWSPFAKKRVFLAGLADMNGTGTDSTREFRQFLKRQGVNLVGEISTSDEKGLPKVIGEVNTKVDYFILGEALDDVEHPRRKDREFREEFIKLQKAQRDKARNLGIPVMTLRKYLQMVGYVPPAVEGKKRD